MISPFLCKTPVLANSRSLWCLHSLLFAQAVVNMELQVASKQLFPTQQNVHVVRRAHSQQRTPPPCLNSSLKVRTIVAFVKMKAPDETSKEVVFYYFNLPSITGLSAETTD